MPARRDVLRVRCPGPLGSCSPACPRGLLCCLCGVLGHLAPVHQFASVVCCVACAVSWATWLLFTGVPAWCVVLHVRCPGPPGSCSPMCPLGALFCLCGVLGHLAPVHRCACLVRCFACAVSWATWLLFTGVPARRVVLRVRCPGPLGSCSPVCPLGVLCCVCGVLGHLAPVHRCARLVCCVVCAVSRATWLLFTGVPALCVALRVRCPGPLGCCSPVCLLGGLFCLCGVLGHLAPVHRCARSVCCVACAVSWATWLLFTGVPAWCVVLRVRYPGPLGSCSPVCPLCVLLCVCGVLGHLAAVHRCACLMGCFACAVSWATWLLFTGVPARCVVFCVRCPGPLGTLSPVCPRGLLCCVCGFLSHLAPVHQCARSVSCFACVVSWTTWLLFTGLPARCVALRVRCPGPLGSCSPVCPLGVLCCVCGVLGRLAPVHRCARSVRCFACAVSSATWLLFTGVPAWWVVLLVRCLGPLGSCSPVCSLGVLCFVCGVLGHLAPVHRCACSVNCFACAVSWATWLPFTGVPARCVNLLVRCPGPPGSCSPVCPLGALLCVCGVLGHLAAVHRCARLVGCFACAVSWATWLLFTAVLARCVVFCVRCPGPLGSCSPVCPLVALLCTCGVLGHLAPVHRCARSVCQFACAVSWATWLLFTGVPARCVVLRVRCPGPLGTCSPVCPRGLLCCVCGVPGHLAPDHRCAHSVPCFARAVSWAIWLLFTGVPAWCVVLCVRCPGPLGFCSPVCPLSVLFFLCGVLGHLAPVHRCARSVCCVLCAVSWATWLLFTGVPAWFVVLSVRFPGPLGSCSPVCPLGVFFRLCGVLGHLAPVQRCARLVRCFARAVSWATWLLFTGVPAWCVVLVVWCPGPFGSHSPVCPLNALFCLCGVLGHLAPVHRCARLVCCVACAVSWATWLLFTGVPARCVVLHVRCPWPLGSCSPVLLLGVLCGVLGHLAPVHRFARSVCCAVGCLCGASVQGADSSIRTVAIRSRQGLSTLRARTRQSGRRLFLASRGWVPSGRTRVHVDGGCSAASRGWVRCRARKPPSGRRLLLLGTCPRAVVRCVLCTLSRIAASGGRRCLAPLPVPWMWPVACLSGVLRGPAWCAAPRPVRSLSVLWSAFPTPWCFSPPWGLAPPALLGGCAGHAEAGREPGSLCLPLAPAEEGRWARFASYPFGTPRWGCPWRVSPVGLGLCALRWLACVDLVTDAFSFPYRPLFDGGLGWCTGAVSCGRRHLPLQVRGRHARVPCVCACARPSWPGWAGRSPGRVLVRLTFSFGRFVFLLCLAPSGLGLPLSWSFVCPPPPLSLPASKPIVLLQWLVPCLPPSFVPPLLAPWHLGLGPAPRAIPSPQSIWSRLIPGDAPPR